MALWDLRAYVTATEWEWMHGNLLITSVAEIDLERPQVCACVYKYAINKSDCEYELLKRGSLCVLQTPKVQEYLVQNVITGRYPFALISVCLGRPLCIVQYYTCLLLRTTFPKDYTLYDIIMQAIYAGRRDVIAWMHREFPSVLEMEASFHNSCEYAIYKQQAWTIRWLCQKYNIAKQHMCNKGACFAAVRERQLKVLQWLRRGRRKCPWDQPKCLEEAQKWGYTEIAIWIRRQPV